MISSGFAPSEVEINSLGIGLSQYGNVSLLDLKDTEYLVVGEQGRTTDSTRDITYSLVVNNDIVGINTTRRRIDGIENDAVKSGSLFVGNDIICDGNIIAKGLEFGNIKLNGDNANLLEDILVSVNNIQPLVFRGYSGIKNASSSLPIRVDNIYTPSFVTLGSRTDTFENTNPLNIISSTNYNANNIHISLENKKINQDGESSKMRVGIIGDTSESPAVITTSKGMPFEFYVGMSTANINRLYSSQIGKADYDANPELKPSFAIDKNGNIGIGVTDTTEISYNKYSKVSDNIILQNEISKLSKIKIQGSADIDDIITYDYYTKTKKHIDDIFVRKAGLNFLANQIIPGDFIEGIFRFNSNLYVGQTGDEYVLEINNVLDVKGDMYVSNNTVVKNLNVEGEAVFENTVQFNKPIYLDDAVVGGNFQINDGQFMIDDTRINIVTLHPSIVDADTEPPTNVIYYANNDMINFSSGSNLIIPGKAGVGVKMNDTYDEQFTVIKRDEKEFEMMLHDKSHEDTDTVTPVANIGHISGLRNVNYIPDKSLIVNTNHVEGKLHNMYFYPGVDIVRNNIDSYVPTMTLHQNNKVGINTKDPKKSLDINGDLLCDDIFVRRNNGSITKTLYFISKPYEGVQLGDVSKDFYYAYDTSGINKYAINFANSDGIRMMGLNVDGGIHSIGNGGYYENNTKLSMLKIIEEENNQKTAYTNEQIILGYNDDTDNYAKKPLSIRNIARQDYNDSIIRIYRAPNLGILNRNAFFSGIDICDYDETPFNPDRNLNKWFMYKNHQIQNEDFVGPLQFGYTVKSEHPTHYGMSMYYDQIKSKYHIDINAPTSRVSDDNTPPSAMSIYGDLDVHGNINIIGDHTYKINGIDVSPRAIDDASGEINNVEETSGTSDGLNDVVISGNKVAIVPKKTLAVGHLDQNFANYLKKIGKVDAYNIPLTVYQNDKTSQVCNFMTFYDTQSQTNSSKMEFGLFDTLNSSGADSTYIDYAGVKKNSVQFKISNYGQQTLLEPTKSVFDISSYNLDTKQYNKMLSIYHNGSTNYVNIGMQNQGHDVTTLGIIDLSNISLHVENPSKYLLQLTNNAREPAINLHRNTGTLNKFWTIEGPNEDENLVFKTSRSISSYIPDDTTSKTVFTITSNSIGVNKENPTHAIDVISDDRMTSMKLTNTYSDFTLEQKSMVTSIKNWDMDYVYDGITYDAVGNTYKGGISYKIDNLNIPLTDNPTSNYNIYKFNANDMAVYDTDTVTSELIIEFNNNIDNFTCNNENIQMESRYLNAKNTISVELKTNSINISNNILLLPDIYHNDQDDFFTNTLLDTSITNDITTIEISKTDQTTSYEYLYTLDISRVNKYSSINANINSILNIDEKITNNIIYTSNTIELRFEDSNGIIDGDSIIENTYRNDVVCLGEITNIVFTIINLYYDPNDIFEIDILSRFSKQYNFVNTVRAPSYILKQESTQQISFVKNTELIDTDGIININETISATSLTDFVDKTNLETVSLSNGVYTITSGQVIHIIGNMNIVLTILLSDEYKLFKYDDPISSDILIKYFDVALIDYTPHIILQNDVKFDDTAEQSRHGIVNKIYSKDGSIEIVKDDGIYTNSILNVNKNGDVDLYGDLRIPGNIYANTEEGGLLSVKSLQLYGDVYDRLGNSMLFNYSEDMYNQAFIMQSSNYTLYTSNYEINSTSNIDFVIDGDSTEGFNFTRIANEQSTYDIFNLRNGDNKVISIVELGDGAKIGFSKEPSASYTLDVADMFRAEIIHSSNIVINGNLLVRGNVQTFGTNIEWETTSSESLNSIVLSQVSDDTYFKIQRKSYQYFVQIENTPDYEADSQNTNLINEKGDIVDKIFNIDKKGRVNIWTYFSDDDTRNSALNVGGTIVANNFTTIVGRFNGNGAGLTTVNLSDRTTDDLQESQVEDGNKYFTVERAENAAIPKINAAKLLLRGEFGDNDSNMSNYVFNVDSNLSENVKDNDSNMSNYVANVDSNLSINLNDNDSNMSNYVFNIDSNLSENVKDNDSNMSNYVDAVAVDTKNEIMDSIYVSYHEIANAEGSTDAIQINIADIPYKTTQNADILYKLLDVSINSESNNEKALIFSGTIVLSYEKETKEILQSINYHTYFSYYFLNGAENQITIDEEKEAVSDVILSRTITIFGNSLKIVNQMIDITLNSSSDEKITMTLLSK
jgi:hypothetical protein